MSSPLPDSISLRQRAYLDALHEATLGLLQHLELETLLQNILQRAAALMGTEHGYVYLLEPGADTMVMRVAVGWNTVALNSRLQPGEGVSGKVWQTGAPLAVNDYQNWSGRLRAADTLVSPLQSVVSVPLKSSDAIVGVLGLGYTDVNKQFGPDELETLTRFAQLASVALANAQLFAAAQAELVERERAQAALAVARDRALEASRAKSVFLANMGHELRTPLNHIIGYSEMALEAAADLGAAEVVTDLEKVNTAGHKLLGIISDILDLSMLEAGKVALIFLPFEVAPLVRELAESARAGVEARGNTLTVEAAPNLGDLRSDRERVKQILLNLLDNAGKFTENGVIILSVKRIAAEGALQSEIRNPQSPDTIVFEISDTGIGIPPEKLGDIFQSFMQVDDSSTRAYGGSGLGLPIARRLCDLLGAEIAVTSAVGQGSQFSVRLPERRA